MSSSSKSLIIPPRPEGCFNPFAVFQLPSPWSSAEIDFDRFGELDEKKNGLDIEDEDIAEATNLNTTGADCLFFGGGGENWPKRQQNQDSSYKGLRPIEFVPNRFGKASYKPPLTPIEDFHLESLFAWNSYHDPDKKKAPSTNYSKDSKPSPPGSKNISTVGSYLKSG